MAGSSKLSANELFRRIASFNTIVIDDLGDYLDKFSPYAKEYESTLDLVIDILLELGESKSRLISDILSIVTGDANIGALIDDSGYHGAINSLESRLALIESKQNNNSFIAALEDGVKVTISTILTALLTCSISPFLPKRCFDTYYKLSGGTSEYPELHPINIPTQILDFSNTLHVSPVSESGIYFYNTPCLTTFYKRDEGVVERSTVTEGDIKESNAEKYKIYTYNKQTVRDENVNYKKVVSVPGSVKVKVDEKPPAEYIYTIRPSYTAESLYKTDDMNAFIWYVTNRGDNTEYGSSPDVIYEYNKMMWDSRRINARDKDTARRSAQDWHDWLSSKTSYDGKLVFEKNGEEVTTMFPILQFEPSEDYGHLEHILVTFPEQKYWPGYKGFPRGIYKFNADYLRSIKIFNWKTIIMNLLYELNGISPIPDIRLHLSLSDEIIDARLSTLILNTIIADDMEVDDSFYSFSNEEYSEALKRMELRKYGAKAYETAGSTAIQNPTGTPLDIMNSVSTAATLNEITTTITRGLYEIAGTSGSTGITKTTLSASLLFESNFIHELLFAIMRPFIRALLSPQIMLLFCINLDVMGLVDLQELGQRDYSLICDFIFRKMSGIIKKFIIFIKDKIILYLLDILKRKLKELIDQVLILMLLEQLNDYIRLLNQIIECLARFSIGRTITGIDDVNYADIIPEKTSPGDPPLPETT